MHGFASAFSLGTADRLYPLSKRNLRNSKKGEIAVLENKTCFVKDALFISRSSICVAWGLLQEKEQDRKVRSLAA